MVGVRFVKLLVGGSMSGLIHLGEKFRYRAPGFLKWAVMLMLAFCELLIVSVRFDSDLLVEGQGVVRFFADRLPLVPQFVAVVLAATLVFGGRDLAVSLPKVSSYPRHVFSVSLFFMLHLLTFALFLLSCIYFFEGDRGASLSVFVIWGLLAFLTAASWLSVVVDPSIWVKVAKVFSGPILIGLCVGFLAWFVGQWAIEAWELLAFATFWLVRLVLTLAFVEISQDQSALSIGTTNFAVTIAPECSGFEGMGLAFVFITTYLWWKRKEHIFPRSLLLIPASICLMFIVNAVRIGALILIGHFGAQEIALGGFHSQAGWIAFNLVTLGLVAFSRTSSWFLKMEAKVENAYSDEPLDYHAVPMLAPFVVLTLSSMLLGAVQSGFDWLYPIRFFIVLAVIVGLFYNYPTEYWKFSLYWPAIGIGVGVYLLWILLEAGDGGAAKILYQSAKSLSPGMFVLWLAFRVLGSVVTVPVAEEFAFRGYLIPWLAGETLEKEKPRHWSWVALIVSSIFFGALHPGRWIAGTVAGLFYGLAFYQRGKVMDAVLAHATTNALIAAEAIALSRWYLWG